MGDPISTGGAKVAEEMLKEVETAAKSGDLHKPEPTQHFGDVLGAQKVGATQNTQQIPDHIRALLEGAKSAQAGAPQVPAIGNQLNTHPLVSGMHKVLDNVMKGQNVMEQIVKISLSGRNLSSSELLGMQAAVYQFTQELELTSKVIEKGTSTIKQTMNTQV